MEPPLPNRVKLNTDDSISVGGLAIFSEVLRDEKRQMVLIFAHELGHCDVVPTLLWAVAIGLKHCHLRGFFHIELNLDSMVAFTLLTDQTNRKLSSIMLFLCAGT